MDAAMAVLAREREASRLSTTQSLRSITDTLVDRVPARIAEIRAFEAARDGLDKECVNLQHEIEEVRRRTRAASKQYRRASVHMREQRASRPVGKSGESRFTVACVCIRNLRPFICSSEREPGAHGCQSSPLPARCPTLTRS
jgi:hypothetical protein